MFGKESGGSPKGTKPPRGARIGTSFYPGSYACCKDSHKKNLTISPFFKSILYNTRYRRVVGILNDQGTSGGVMRLPDRAFNLMKRGSSRLHHLCCYCVDVLAGIHLGGRYRVMAVGCIVAVFSTSRRILLATYNGDRTVELWQRSESE
jgi:hypothetical protein